MRIDTILKCRRINFLHYIVSSDHEKSLYKFYDVQFKYPDKGDWTLLVQQDLKDFNIESDFQFFQKSSKKNLKSF